jgi:hypothetical protein
MWDDRPPANGRLLRKATLFPGCAVIQDLFTSTRLDRTESPHMTLSDGDKGATSVVIARTL